MLLDHATVTAITVTIHATFVVVFHTYCTFVKNASNIFEYMPMDLIMSFFCDILKPGQCLPKCELNQTHLHFSLTNGIGAGRMEPKFMYEK